MPNTLSIAQETDAKTLDGQDIDGIRDHAPKAHTHVELNITDLDHDAQKIKGVLIDDAAKADQKVLGYDSATERIVYITQAPPGATIKSIQQGSITLTGTSATATITSVDTAKSMLLFNGFTHDAADTKFQRVYLRLTNATTVTATMITNVDTLVLRFTVIEFDTGINLIQRGLSSIDYNATTRDVTITSVDLDKAWLNFLGAASNSSGCHRTYPNAYLLNATTIRLTRTAGNGGCPCSWEVIEFTG